MCGHENQIRRMHRSFDADEASLSEKVSHLVSRVKAVHLRREVRRPAAAGGAKGEHQASAGRQDAADLAQVRGRRLPEVESVHGERLVERTIGEGQVAAVAALEPDVPASDQIDTVAGSSAEHLVGMVDPGDGTLRKPLGGALDGVAVAETDFENAISRAQLQKVESDTIGAGCLDGHQPAERPSEPTRWPRGLACDELGTPHALTLRSCPRSAARAES